MSAERAGPQVNDGVPSMLDLVRLSPRPVFPPGGRDLYHQIALLTGMKEGDEVLVAACGAGLTLEYFVREFGVQGSGVEEDPLLIQWAEARARGAELQNRLQFQHGSMSSLPYRDGVFDVTVAELGLTARADPRRAVEELVRVTRPGGCIAVVQLVWQAPVDEARQEILADHLGARPLMLVELKRLLKETGVERLHTEAWSDEETAFRPQVKKPFPDFAELFSVPEKLRILRRAWRRWGWKGVRVALVRESEVHRLLTRERILGLDLIKGRKRDDAGDDAGPASEEGRAGGDVRRGDQAPGDRPREGRPGGDDSPEDRADRSSEDRLSEDRLSEDRSDADPRSRGAREGGGDAFRGLPLFKGEEGS